MTPPELISVGLYILAVIAQVCAAGYAVNLSLQSKSYRLASGFLAVAFTLMIGRRVAPLQHFYSTGFYSITDALLAFVISIAIFYGSLQVRKIILELEEKNFILDRTSKIDSLTRALSRSETFARSELEIERALRNNKPVGFLMLDIDHFKNVNDHYGHPAGDAVLQGLTQHCQEELRAIDIFGRVGGEEFFVVLPETNEGLAFDVAERLRKKVFSSPSAVIDGKAISISISIGISTFDPSCHGENHVDVILRSCYKKADDAMYLAKTSGRNRTELWTESLNRINQ
jgi:diguanylate cyclase (GGDEF)-like protein